MYKMSGHYMTDTDTNVLVDEKAALMRPTRQAPLVSVSK